MAGPIMDMATSTPSQDPHFRFLDLPVELRLQIYEYLLVDRSRLMPTFNGIVPIYPMCTDRKWPYPSENIETLTLGILRVSKAVSEEASPIFYGKNIFLIPTFPLDYANYKRRWRSVFKRVAKHKIGMIRHVLAIFDGPRPLDGCEGDIWDWHFFYMCVSNAVTEIRMWYKEVGILWERLQSWAYWSYFRHYGVYLPESEREIFELQEEVVKESFKEVGEDGLSECGFGRFWPDPWRAGLKEEEVRGRWIVKVKR